MMRFNRGGVTALLLALSGTAYGTPVSITNAGFESPVLADGAQVSAATGWIRFGSLVFTNPTVSQFTDQAYEGQNVALFTGGATLTQIVGTLDYGTYTLTAAVGDPLGASLSGLSLSLRRGTSFLSPTSTSLLPPPDGGYAVLSRIFEVTPTNANGTFYADTFNIFVLVSGGGQVALDDVRLDLSPLSEPSPVPEPASLGLLSLAVLTLWFRRRRRDLNAARG
jgi:hypothetical protein